MELPTSGETATMISQRIGMQPCPVGGEGFCCKACLMGPCRILTSQKRSICGATQSLVTARNIVRFTAGGAAAHCGHAYHLLEFLNRDVPQDYVKSKAPPYLQEIWDNLGIVLPQKKLEHFKDISEALHLSTLGVNSDYMDVMKWCLKLGIIDGYYGQYLSTELEDEAFGKPKIRKGRLNLNCLDPARVNIAVHGHEPMLAESLLQEAARYDDVNLVGVCCTGASLLAIHNIPLAAHFVLQENVVASGVVDALVVDVQCVMPSLSDLCECYHTKLITTSAIGRIPNALHLPVFNCDDAEWVANKILRIARENKKNRKKDVAEKFEKKGGESREAVVGFSEENIDIGDFAQRLENGQIKGIIAVVGCVNPRCDIEDWVRVFQKLSDEYLILTTGCMAFELGQHGLLDGQRFFHLGSCVNNARIAKIFGRLADCLGKRITELPLLVSAPAPITEKSMSIGFFFASIGCSVHFGYPYLLSSDQNIGSFLISVLANIFNSQLFLESQPSIFYEKITTEGIRPPD